MGRLIRALVRAIDRTRGNPTCRACGCTDHAACPGGCWWVQPDLCSSCSTDGLA
jgi:hypothetical protein